MHIKKGSGIAISLVLGVVIGMFMDNIAVGIAIGLALGIALQAKEKDTGDGDKEEGKEKE